MKQFFLAICLVALITTCAYAQSPTDREPSSKAEHSSQSMSRADQSAQSDDIQQLRSDLERLRVVLNQMRTNLAFVQTSQTPLKHQFELETDAWQVVIDGMQRRLDRMEKK